MYCWQVYRELKAFFLVFFVKANRLIPVLSWKNTVNVTTKAFNVCLAVLCRIREDFGPVFEIVQPKLENLTCLDFTLGSVQSWPSV
jgi:hypothetical protein